MWTDKTRLQHDRSGLRYTHDLTDTEWALVEPLIPPAKRGGNKRTVNIRVVVNGLMYLLGTGCQWRDIPKDLAPRSTVHDYLGRWDYDGMLDNIHHTLYIQCRELAERPASPCCRKHGWSSERSLGSTDAADWPRTGNASIAGRAHF
jgi:transposase